MATATAYYGLKKYASVKIKCPESYAETMVIIPPGTGFSKVVELLKNQGRINHPVLFKLYARLNRHDSKVQAGEYLLPQNASPEELINVIVSGRVRLYRVTIPEGYSIYQTAELMMEKGFFPAEKFIEAASDKEIMTRHNIPGPTLEGYLFPETYFFPKKVTATAAVSTMVKRFFKEVPPGYAVKAQELGHSFHEMVTLASIIEKETGAPAEREIISSVFHNRLKKRMRLETDPTVIYGIKNFNGNITRKDLRTKTPYNTYMIRGLPPGPIANPGLAAIHAALYPANSRYIFFVSKKDGTHQFSTNIHDHNRAVRQYQLRRKRK